MLKEDDTNPTWDIFISYASEDREAVAAPLAHALRSLGLQVWYDQTELKLGMSLRRAIDEGLSRCRHGIVILSKAFFSKHYPNRELDGLAQRESDGEPILLPIWHDVSATEVRKYSPPLADRIAAAWSHGLPAVLAKILEVVRPDAVEAANRALAELKPLPRLKTGSEVLGVVTGSYAFHFASESPNDEAELELVSGFLQELQDLGDIVGGLDIGDRIKAEYSINESLQDLEKAGWKVLGKQAQRPIGLPPRPEEKWTAALVFVARETTQKVIEMGDGKYLVMPGSTGSMESSPKIIFGDLDESYASTDKAFQQDTSEAVSEPPQNPIRSKVLADKIKQATAMSKRQDSNSALRLWNDVQIQAASEGNRADEICARLRGALILVQDEEHQEDAKRIAEACFRDVETASLGSHRSRILQLIGEIHRVKGDTDQARGFLTSALKYAQSSGSSIDEGFALLSLSALEKSDQVRGTEGKAVELVDRAYKAFSSAYAAGDNKDRECAQEGYAQCHFWKAELLGTSRQDEALAEWSQALSLFQQLGDEWRWNVADTFFGRASFNSRIGETHLAVIDLESAAELFGQLGDTVGVAKCYLEGATILDTIGRTTEASKAYEAACAIAATWNNDRRASYYYFRYACKLMELRNYEKAEEILLSLLNADRLGSRRKLDVISQLCLMAQAMEDEGKLQERSKLTLELLDEAMRETDSAKDRRHLLIRKGHCFSQLEKHEQALECFRKAMRGFESVGDQAHVIECWFHIRGVMQQLGDRKGEREAAEKVLALGAEESNPMFASLSLVTLAQLNIKEHRHLEASSQLEQAKMLAPDNPIVRMISNDLHDKSPKLLPKSVRDLENANRPPQTDLPSLIHELHDWCAAYPKKARSILIVWYYIHRANLWGVMRSMLGIKFLICTVDAAKFQSIVHRLRPHGDLFLWGTNFPIRTSTQRSIKRGLDLIPVPRDFVYPAGTVVLANRVSANVGVRGKKRSRGDSVSRPDQGSALLEPYYLLYIEGADGRPGVRPYFAGRRRIWRNSKVVKFMLSRSDSDLIEGKVLCVPLSEDNPLSEGNVIPSLRPIMQVASENSAIPVFPDVLPAGEDVKSVCDCMLELPTATDIALDRTKDIWGQLLSSCLDSPKSSLGNFIKAMSELLKVSLEQRVPVRVYLLWFMTDSGENVYPAVVVPKVGSSTISKP